MRHGLQAAGVILLVLGCGFGLQRWTSGLAVESTNDAYLQADAVTVAPKVQGYVEQVYVADNQPVTPGQALARIDSRSYEAVLAQQDAETTGREAAVQSAEGQVAEQQASLEQAHAQTVGARADAAFTQAEAERFSKLSAEGVETQERAAQARRQRDQAQATLAADLAAERRNGLQLKTLAVQVDQSRAQLQAAEAQARSARFNVGDSMIRASIAGRVGDKSVRAGQFVSPGMRLMSIVPTDQVYLVANFKETQIGRMRVGDHATVRLDAFPGRRIDAVVQSFAPGTGSQFALLPAQNATGNFTKVVQRVPVRLQLHGPSDIRDRLLPGLSATVSVNTSQGQGTGR